VAHGKARHVVQSDRGDAQLYRVLESLAVLEAKGRHRLEQVLKVEGGRMPRGSNIVVITASVRPSLLASLQELGRRGLSPMLLLLEAESFGGAVGARALAKSAEQLGILTRLVSYGEALAEALAPGPTSIRRGVAA
jgi:hypothetical protein